jgi:hypothetical protein
MAAFYRAADATAKNASCAATSLALRLPPVLEIVLLLLPCFVRDLLGR